VKRWNEIKGQELFIFQFLENYFKDFIDSQSNQINFFNEIEPKTSKKKQK